MDNAILLPVTDWILIIGRAISICGPLQYSKIGRFLSRSIAQLYVV
jgi:hypothetical protein